MLNIKSKEDSWAHWLYIQDLPGVGFAKLKYLYDKAGSLEAIIEQILSGYFSNEWVNALKPYLKNINIEKYKNVVDKTFQCGASICSIEDNNYPFNLKISSVAPPILFYKGSLGNISERSLALVGTVTPTELGVARAKKFASLCIKNNIQVISGLARGIDTISHKTALENEGITYAVIGHGIDHCYPEENKSLFDEITKKGAVISQFPTGTKPNKWMFPARNETMCTLSSGTVIIEAHNKCGSLIQAKYSFKHQRRVFILYNNLIEGNGWANKLVDDGAITVKEFDIVAKEMSQINQNFIDNQEQKQLEISSLNENKLKRKTFLFDLDGVLYDSRDFMEKIYIDIVKTIKKEVIENDIEMIKRNINNAPTYVLKSVGIDPVKGNNLYKTMYLDYAKKGITFFMGIENVIKTLKEKQYAIGIVTSQPLSRYKAIISSANFKDLIDVAVTWNDVPRKQQKPHPAGINLALNNLNVDTSNAIYIGDDPKDIEAAKNANIKSAAALWGSSTPDLLLDAEPDYKLEKPEEILTIEL